MSSTTTNVCVLTDLHIGDNTDIDFLEKIASAVVDCDLIILSGDIVNIEYKYVHPSPEKKQIFIEKAMHLIGLMDKPFMFTLGNHDTIIVEGFWKEYFVGILMADSHQIGECNESGNACFHPSLGIAVLYTGRDYGIATVDCNGPNKTDVKWLNDNVGDRNIELFAIHIPPAQILGLEINGVYDEKVCCWGEKDYNVGNEQLANFTPKYSVFGHDHANIGITEPHPETGTKYVYGFKSGHLSDSYDGNFPPNDPGYTLL